MGSSHGGDSFEEDFSLSDESTFGEDREAALMQICDSDFAIHQVPVDNSNEEVNRLIDEELRFFNIRPLEKYSS